MAAIIKMASNSSNQRFSATSNVEAQRREHHKQVKTCYTRPKYRQGRRDRAVKVYTINQESVYLLILNVPALGVTKELMEQLSLYGEIEEYRVLYDYPCEEFTEVYWVQYRTIEAARAAKRKMDGRPFFSSLLHVCYAPEFEGAGDVKAKLDHRRTAVLKRLRQLNSKEKKTSVVFVTSGSSKEGNPQGTAPASTHIATTASGTFPNVQGTSPSLASTSSAVGQPILPLLPPPPIAMAISHQYASPIQHNPPHAGSSSDRQQLIAHRIPAHDGHMTTSTATAVSSGSCVSPVEEDGRRNVQALSLDDRKAIHMFHSQPAATTRWEKTGVSPTSIGTQHMSSQVGRKSSEHGQQERNRKSVSNVTSDVKSGSSCTSVPRSLAQPSRERSKGYFTFGQDPPSNPGHLATALSSEETALPSGNRSVDRSIADVRRTMGQVMKSVAIATEPAKRPPHDSSQVQSKTKKRRRI